MSITFFINFNTKFCDIYRIFDKSLIINNI